MLNSRYSRFVVLACLLALGMFLAALQNRAAGTDRPSTASTIIRTVLSPFQSAIHAMEQGAHGVRLGLRTRRQALRENTNLRKEVLALAQENAKLRGERAENERLRSLLEFKNNPPGKVLMARVIARGSSQWHDTCTIDRGWRDGVKKTDPVVTPRGVVGQVIDVSPGVSQVLLLTDESCGVGAVLQRSRAAGICEGQQTGSLSMNYLNKDADVQVGDLVVTSGIGQVYPKDLDLGRVMKIHSTSGFMKSAEIRPSVEFDKLEEAAVIIREPGH
jgi:rod shape-determining protein MreC